jgi:hypothetical protein
LLLWRCLVKSDLSRMDESNYRIVCGERVCLKILKLSFLKVENGRARTVGTIPEPDGINNSDEQRQKVSVGHEQVHGH